MISRRDYLKLCLATGVTLSLKSAPSWAVGEAGAPNADRKLELITRAIPSSGERLPAVGLGSSATFAEVARSADIAAVREVLQALVAHGGRDFDTAPSYGASEAVAGRIAAELAIPDKLFWATKLNVAGWGGGSADPAAARAQLETSFQRLGKPVLDLIQVHNLGDVPTQLGLLKDLRAEKRVRYIGVTTTVARQYAELEQILAREPIDFIGIDYAIDNRTMEERILPLARDRGVGGGVRCALVGAVLSQVRAGAPGRHRGHARHQQGAAHDRQPRRRARGAAGCGPAAADDCAGRGFVSIRRGRGHLAQGGS